MQIPVSADHDCFSIGCGEPQPALIDSFGDHRVAMSFAVTGLRADGIVISDPECCAKTFENYFDVLESLFS